MSVVEPRSGPLMISLVVDEWEFTMPSAADCPDRNPDDLLVRHEGESVMISLSPDARAAIVALYDRLLTYRARSERAKAALEGRCD